MPYLQATAVQTQVGLTNALASLTVVAGSLLVVPTQNNSPSGTVVSVVGSLNGAYTKAKAQFYNFSSKNLELWYFSPSAAGTETITVTYSASVDSGVILAEYSLPDTSPLDQTASASSVDGSGTGSLSSGATAATTKDLELVIGVGGKITTGSTFTATDGSTIRSQGGTEPIALADKTVQAMAAYTATMTSDNTTDDWACIIATFFVRVMTPQRMAVQQRMR